MFDSNKANADYLASLPYDIISEMVSRMDISTVDNLKRQISFKWNYEKPDSNKYKGVADACDDRKSVVKYLNKHFGDGVALLEAMSKYYTYISGSRSLEFFSEGHTDINSDWDFYVSTWPGHIAGIMKELEKLGVSWMSPEEEIDDLKKVGKGSLVLERAKFLYLLNKGRFGSSDGDIQGLIETMRHSSVDAVTLVIDGDNSTFKPTIPGDGYVSDKTVCIIRGKLTRKGRTTAVQLIVEHRDESKAAISSPFTYHSSCVQSVIGPYRAFHMYGRLTSENKSYGWRDNISDEAKERLGPYDPFASVDTKPVAGWSKYSSRGFEYITPPELTLGFELRNTCDDESVWLEYSDHSEAPHDVVTLYTQLSKSVAWYQVATGTVPVHFPMRSTYNHNKLDFGSWFNTSKDITQDVSQRLDKCLPHMEYKYRNSLTSVAYPREV